MRWLIDYDVNEVPTHGQKTMLKRLRGMFSTDLSIDLGTANTLIS